jgi:hypothetical protein
MHSDPDNQQDEILNWCGSVLGPVEVLADQTRDHPGKRTGALRLRTAGGVCYVKILRDRARWESEVHGYEQWAPAFGNFAPKLLAVREIEPLAVVISELPGKIMEGTSFSVEQEHAIWRDAGHKLAALHDSGTGECFGPCRRDGACLGRPVRDAVEYVSAEFENLIERGLRIGCLDDKELAIVRAARKRIPAFAGERPVACHRDYGPANWMVGADGNWTGVIDFEFAYWDVRVADFTRYPGWEWISRPDLIAAFFEGYGRALSGAEEQQCLVGHVLYALGAIVWGEENDYHGFAAEGRHALRHLMSSV